MVLVVVQPVDHRRVFGYFHEDGFVVSKSFVSEHVNHVFYLVIMIDFRDPGRKDLMVEEAKFLLEWRPCIDHSPDPTGMTTSTHGPRFPPVREISKEFIVIDRYLQLRMQQFFHRCLIACRDSLFEFVSTCAEPSPSHQVCH